MKKTENKIPVVITTEHRGVFFGYIEEGDYEKDNLEVHKLQMCVRWTEDMFGVLGLAFFGPSSSCRISKPISKGFIKNVTAVLSCDPKAVKNWEKCPWG